MVFHTGIAFSYCHSSDAQNEAIDRMSSTWYTQAATIITSYLGRNHAAASLVDILSTDIDEEIGVERSMSHIIVDQYKMAEKTG